MPVTLPIPADTAIITDDECVAPAVLVDPVTGTFRGYTSSFPCGSESGHVMQDGTIATPDDSGGAGRGVLGIYNRNLTLLVNAQIGNYPAVSVFITGVTDDRSTYFYVISADSSNNLTLHKVTTAGVTLQTWALGVTSVLDPVPMAVSRDGVHVYYWRGTGNAFNRFNTSTGVTTTLGTPTTVSGIEIGADGNLYLARSVGGVGTIEKYDTSLSLLGAVTTGAAPYTTLGFCHLSSDDLHIFHWNQTSGSPTRLSSFTKVRLSDLAVISQRTGVLTDTVSGTSPVGTAISNSCPLLIAGTPEAGNCPDLTLTGMGIECETGVITITGTGFLSTTIVSLVDPDSVVVPVTAVDVTATRIRMTATNGLVQDGLYCATVTNPVFNDDDGDEDGEPDPPLPPDPPGADCAPLTTISGAPAWFVNALIAVGATQCYEASKFLAIEGTANTNSMAPQRGTLCNVRPRLHEGTLTKTHCGHPMVDFTLAFTDHNIDQPGPNGTRLWHWD